MWNFLKNLFSEYVFRLFVCNVNLELHVSTERFIHIYKIQGMEWQAQRKKTSPLHLPNYLSILTSAIPGIKPPPKFWPWIRSSVPLHLNDFLRSKVKIPSLTKRWLISWLGQGSRMGICSNESSCDIRFPICFSAFIYVNTLSSHLIKHCWFHLKWSFWSDVAQKKKENHPTDELIDSSSVF